MSRGFIEANEAKAIVLLVAALSIAPLIASKFYVRLLSIGVLYGLAAVGFNILYGYTGLLSFGHAMFWAAGAYGLSIGLVKLGLSPVQSILLATSLIFVVSLSTGYLSLRHTRIYFAMLTLAFAQLIYALIIKLRDVTGGDEGIYNIPRYPADINMYYYVILAVSTALLILAYWLVRTPFGLSLKAVRDNPMRAEALGIPVSRIRLISYTLSGLYVGVAGMLYAPLQRAITPDIAYWTFSALIVIVTILGGSRSVIGPFIGGLIFVFIINEAMTATPLWRLLMGGVLAGLVYLSPRGLAGFIDSMYLRWVRWIRSWRGLG